MSRPKERKRKCGVPGCKRDSRNCGMCDTCSHWVKRHRKLNEFIRRGWAKPPRSVCSNSVAAQALAQAERIDDAKSRRVDRSHKATI